jgi:hypothetical protein
MYNCGDVCKGECNWEKISIVDETEKDLYSNIENSIISWNIDGTRTAGSLTREIMELIKERYKK